MTKLDQLLITDAKSVFLAHLVFQHVHVIVGSLRSLVRHLFEVNHQVGHVHPKLFTVRDSRHRVTGHKSQSLYSITQVKF